MNSDQRDDGNKGEDNVPATFSGFVDRASLRTDSEGGYNLVLAGWLLLLDGNADRLSFTVLDGDPVEAVLHERPDVAARLTDIPHALHSGFQVAIPVERVAEEYLVHFNARLPSGAEIASQFSVKPERGRGGGDGTSTPFGSVETRSAVLNLYRSRLLSFLRSEVIWDFSPPPSVVLSVVIPVRNQAHLTFGCLEALRLQQGVSYEVIIVDNGSDDDTVILLKRCRGIRVVRWDEGRSFSASCNGGAKLASGSILLFLNNDAFVQAGALQAAVSCLEGRSDVGVVGGKLLRVDGKLQEVGAFVLPNGSTVSRGRGADPSRELYGGSPFLVDFCSGAFLVTPTKLFKDLRGFDERFTPAYYEDVDYCARVLKRGLLCLIQPKAEILHVERGSTVSHSETDSDLKRNQGVFLDFHRDFFSRPLARRWSEVNARTVLDSEPSTAITDRILMIDDAFPLAERGQGQGRAALVLKTLQSIGKKVVFFEGGEVRASTAAKSALPGAVEIVAPSAGESPISAIRRLIQTVAYVWVSRPQHMEVLQAALRNDPVPPKIPMIIYDAEALQAKREILKVEVIDGFEMSDDEIVEIVSNEVVLARDADKILTASPQEAAAFVDFGFSAITILSHGVTVNPQNRTFGARKNFLTVGPLLEDDTPNTDGLRWFVERVQPLLHQLLARNPTVTGRTAVHAAGEHTVSDLVRRQDDSFRLLGHLANLTPLYDAYRVFIAPTRFCAGIPLKVIEAAAHGIPIVATPIVASQLGWRDEHELLIGYSAEDFAAKCAALYVNEELWMSLREQALLKIRTQFDVAQFEGAIRAVFAMP